MPARRKKAFLKTCRSREMSEGENGAKFSRWENFASLKPVGWAMLRNLFAFYYHRGFYIKRVGSNGKGEKIRVTIVQVPHVNNPLDNQ